MVMDRPADLGPRGARAASHLAPGGLRVTGRLRLKRTGRLLDRRAVRYLAGQFPQLLVALPAGSRPEHEADAEAGKEHEPVPHLAPLFHLRSPNGPAGLPSPPDRPLLPATPSFRRLAR